MKKLLIILSFTATAICWADPMQISVTGTANSTTLGYTSGQSYTFNWVINEAYTGNAGFDIHDAGENKWLEETTTHSMVFSALSGDGISGTYSQPSAVSTSPYSYLQTSNDTADKFTVFAASDNTQPLGIQAGGNDVTALMAYDLERGDFTFPGTYTDPTTYFSAYTGSHALTGGAIQINTTGGAVFFTATNTTIEAIPEPATLAFVGIFGGGLWFIRRYFPSV